MVELRWVRDRFGFKGYKAYLRFIYDEIKV